MSPELQGKGCRGTVAIDTHGCKLNQADSEALARQFIQAGYRIVDPKDGPDIYVLNTCTVTHVADAKARQALRSARRRNPNSTVVATGCYAQRAPDALLKVHGVNLVVGNRQKEGLAEMALQVRGEPTVPCSTGEAPVARPGTNGRTRAMVKIQEGCNQVCAYCIVPRVRGRERSIPPELLLRQVQQRVAEGYKEIVLTGTQLGSYGFDLSQVDLKSMVELLLQRTGVERLRVSSLQPQEITPGLLRLWEDPRLCPHFHMPLQSGSNRVLKRMRRRYTADLYKGTVEKILQRLPHAAVTADVIVGFPGEGEEEFEQSLRFCQSLDLADMHVFPYSVRPGTSAAYMGPQVVPRDKRARMERMLALAQRKASTFRRRSLEGVRPVLWEREDTTEPGMYLGLTDNYLRVRASSPRPLINCLAPARLVREQGAVIYSELV